AGLFDKPFLRIRSTGKLAFLRYAEFFEVRENKIVSHAIFFDLIALMQQVGLNPLPVETGHTFVYPGPCDHNGLLFEEQDPKESKKTIELVEEMVKDLDSLNKSGNDNCPPELLAKCWSEDMVWYGPAGIGATYTIERYQQQHQFPFRKGLKDKVFNGHVARFSEGSFACFFGWPNLSNTAGGGLFGMPASGIRADMRVVDVYYRKGDKLLENWVLMDVPYWLKQQGLDILSRTTTYS
ncbi:MAG TPA: polyketide cyclase, partial [Alteromonas macleodii]|nr:polyketide cyclase [Alteromonas macleodii]